MRAVLVLVTLAACAPKPPPADVAQVLSLPPSDETAGAILFHRCTPCHIGGHPDAKPAALAIFDLTRADWAKGLDERKLRTAIDRLSATDGEEIHFRAWVAWKLAQTP